ncbi:MAG: hypothetical protein E6J39_03060 [Chloroflexi bacterium]|nr:MAG: hypothetical protein E6J39_03060 [Chloroflexota bacterium]
MTRRILLAVVWAYAAWTWTTIGHVFVSTPDIGPVVALIIGLAIVARPSMSVAGRFPGAHPKTASPRADL